MGVFRTVRTAPLAPPQGPHFAKTAAAAATSAAQAPPPAMAHARRAAGPEVRHDLHFAKAAPPPASAPAGAPVAAARGIVLDGPPQPAILPSHAASLPSCAAWVDERAKAGRPLPPSALPFTVVVQAPSASMVVVESWLPPPTRVRAEPGATWTPSVQPAAPATSFAWEPAAVPVERRRGEPGAGGAFIAGSRASSPAVPVAWLPSPSVAPALPPPQAFPWTAPAPGGPTGAAEGEPRIAPAATGELSIGVGAAMPALAATPAAGGDVRLAAAAAGRPSVRVAAAGTARIEPGGE